jgi:predicted small metal-binding protein
MATLVIKCECGYVVRGADEHELLERAGLHIQQTHPALEGKVTQANLLAMAEEE